jgi:hypothetical protein
MSKEITQHNVENTELQTHSEHHNEPPHIPKIQAEQL